MKKKIVMLALVAGAFVQQANAQKGGILLYGDFNFTSQTNKVEQDFGGGTISYKNKSTSGTFAPGIGYGVTENIIVGLNIGITSQTVKPDGGDKSTSSMFAAGPFVRYTKKLGGIFSVYGQANLSYVGGKETVEDGYFTYDTKLSGVDFNITPNFGADLGKGWGLDFGFGSIGFSSITNKIDDADSKSTTSGFELDLSGSSVRVGVSYMFGGGSAE